MEKAWFFNSFGTSDVLYQKEVIYEEPLKDNEILIKVYACGINPIDAKIRNGSSFVSQKRLNTVPFPWTLGYDVAGIVQDAGPKSAFSKGDAVCGCAGYLDNPCGCATLVKCSDTYFTTVPNGVSLIQAAALPIAGVTALDISQSVSSSITGRILLSGATGGVGHILCRLFALQGYDVTALSSRDNFVHAYKAGACECLDYTEDLSFYEHKFDLVIDMLGGEIGKSLYRFIKAGGLFVTVPTYSKKEVIEHAKNFERVTATDVLAHVDKVKLAYLLNLMREQKLMINVSSVFAFDDLKRAHEQIESTHTVGKIVLKV